MTLDPSLLFGPFAALALALLILGLFYTGRVLPRNTVPREDYEELRAINATYAAGFSKLTEAVKGLTITVDRIADRTREADDVRVFGPQAVHRSRSRESD